MCGSLFAYTTFGIGGPAREIFVVRAKDQLIEYANSGALILGGGSNVLVSDDGYDGTVVINRYRRLEHAGAVVAGSGLKLTTLCYRLAELGKSGMEWAVGIPGSVGGAVRMNAGAFGSCMADRLLYADVMRNGKIVRMSRDDLRFGYRQSAISSGDVVIDVALDLSADSPSAIERRMNEFIARRKQSQPIGKSAGSVFKNPPGQHIAQLIEQAGLKGYKVGGAQISQSHANIIVNTGGATAKDVVSIIKKVKDELLIRYGVAAEEEIVYIGDFV